MSWSVNLARPARKEDAAQAINDLQIAFENMGEIETAVRDAMQSQLVTAKDAAIRIVESIPGPYIMVSLSGHANAVGDQRKPGYANDCILVNVSQACEEDLKYYQ